MDNNFLLEKEQKDSFNGLTNEEVKERIEKKQVNNAKVEVGKSYIQIIFTDLFSFFNVLLFAVAGLMIYAQYFDGLFFLVVLIPNIGITLYEDIHARHLLGKLNMISQPEVTAIRNGGETTIKSNEIVLDDLLHINGNSQICTDAIVLSGELLVNESLLTGESKPVKKTVNDKILAGSYTVSGDAIVKTVAVGKECYIETIHEKANKFKRTHSEIKASMKYLFLGIGIVVISIAIAMCIVYSFQGKFNNVELVKEAIRTSISGSMVAMIPSGMYLLTSAVFSLSVIKLSEKKAQIQDFYSVEMLSKINVLCVDKTGTITDGKLNVKEIKKLNSSYDENKIGDILHSLVVATKDNNETAQCILRKFENNGLLQEKTHISFTSENKYSAITLANNETFVLGAYECISTTKSELVEKTINEYLENGYRVLTLAHNYYPIQNEKVTGSFEVIALIIVEDHIKEDAKETFANFIENGVEIRVISGDNAKSVSHIAQEVGIPNADLYISLEGMSVEQVKTLVDRYVVFGRVTPEQKEAIVTKLRANHKKVAMTGDGVNDILALKRADCSIAMANGSDAARNVSNIVLLDSNFKSLPAVVSEGRRIVCNLQRTCSLFLSKTMFAMFFSAAFLILSVKMNNPDISYPFRTNHLYLWEICGIGMSAFFLALEKNDSKYEGHFMKNILRNAIPAGLIMILATSLMFILYYMQGKNHGYFGIIDKDTVVAMSAICFSLLGLVVLYRVCEPLNKYRTIVFSGACLFEVAWAIIAMLITFKDGNSDRSILRIAFEKMTPTSWFVTGIVTVLCATLYICATYIIKIVRGGKENVKN